jgi:hypothetical protein
VYILENPPPLPSGKRDQPTSFGGKNMKKGKITKRGKCEGKKRKTKDM